MTNPGRSEGLTIPTSTAPYRGMNKSADNANDPVTITLSRAEAGIVRTLLGAHRGTLDRKLRNAERKNDPMLEVRREHYERDTALTDEAYRKVKRAMWGKSA